MAELTKLEALRIENQVLRDSIERMKRARDKLNNVFLGDVHGEIAMIKCLGSIDSAVDYEKHLKLELERAVYVKSKTQKDKPSGKSEKKISVTPV